MHTSMLTAVVVCVLAHSKMSAAHKKEKKKETRQAPPFFFCHSYNANDDTTFTSNYLLVNFSSLQESSLSLSLFPREGRRRGDGQRDEKRRAPFVGGPSCVRYC
jgi:hypothetical protein